MIKIDYITIGKTIHNYRIIQEMTQEQLSEDAGISPGYLSKIEKGNKKPSLEVLLMIAYCLGISLDDLVYSDRNIENFGLTKRMMTKLMDECSQKEQEIIYTICLAFIKYLADNGMRL